MPDVETMAVFLAATFALLVVPGPAVLYIVARGIEQLDRIRFEAINPIFLIAATKPA